MSNTKFQMKQSLGNEVVKNDFFEFSLFFCETNLSFAYNYYIVRTLSFSLFFIHELTVKRVILVLTVN